MTSPVLPAFIYSTIAATAIWTFFDARALGIRKDKEKKSFFNMNPVSWAFATLFIWIVAFPAYILRRRKETKVGAIGASLMTRAIIGGVWVILLVAMTWMGSGRLEKKACGAVSNISIEYGSEIRCVSVKLDDEPSPGFHTGRAYLTDGRIAKITVQERGDDNVYVRVTGQAEQ